MKMRLTFHAILLLLALLVLGGCATRNKINWSARVGTYTFDQAVIDLGPPAKQARLQDGTLVAEWQTERGYAQTHYPPPYYYGYRYRHYGYYGAPVTTYSPDVFLRLTFAPDGKLAAWKKVVL